MSFIPNPSDLWAVLRAAVVNEINGAIASLVTWLWKPLRGWLGDAAWLLVNMPLALKQTASTLGKLSQRMFEFFDDAPRYVAGWVLAGFLYWIEGVGDLLDDYVDRHWED